MTGCWRSAASDPTAEGLVRFPGFGDVCFGCTIPNLWLRLLNFRRMPAFDHPVEELADQPQRIHLIVMPAGRERQQLGTKISIPGRCLGNVQAVDRHATADALRPHRLFMPGRKLFAIYVGFSLARLSLKKWTDAGCDLPLLLGPVQRFPFSPPKAELADQNVSTSLAPPHIQPVATAAGVNANNNMACVVAAIRGNGIVRPSVYGEGIEWRSLDVRPQPLSLELRAFFRSWSLLVERAPVSRRLSRLLVADEITVTVAVVPQYFAAHPAQRVAVCRHCWQAEHLPSVAAFLHVEQ